MGRIKGCIGIALLAGAVVAGASGCGGSVSAGAGAASGPQAGASASTGAGSGGGGSVSASPTRPAGPPMLLNTIAPADGSTVGVAMPISIAFTKPVAPSARKTVEQHLKVTTSAPVTGAWHWFGDARVDWRPQTYWKPGTKVTVTAALQGVADGNGRYGTHAYTHSFTIGPDIETTVSVPGHTMVVKRDGAVVRTMPIDAGSPSFPSWDGTMAVMDKQPEVHMTSCSVHITCDPKNPNFYDLTLPWDVHLTGSGTYVHYSDGDKHPGHSVGSHGCVHLSMTDATWFYDYVHVGDPVTITGSPRGAALADNGYASFDLTWPQWLAGSANGPETTTAGASA
ncbi:L,D-transpeptidase [Streptacidiphilus melanogenes]|uniref:L,D-transpeptidase n=1 Tax=Streptacidiphilus melanogenes TaxID=411235 RepID=UPI0005A8E582|nr:L,D-transpeptidase [Streptacidiphilus melanogenes]